MQLSEMHGAVRVKYVNVTIFERNFTEWQKNKNKNKTKTKISRFRKTKNL